MKTSLITSDIRGLFWNRINQAIPARLIPSIHHNRKSFLARANRALKRNLAEPGDCTGDMILLIGLALAEAELGRGTGWIPAVQMLGCKIAGLPR
jgi:hypothetical protein